ADYQRLSDAARERPDAQQINTLMLRSMQQAIYSPHNSGHFGLAYEAYAHFTSPIRRYPDLLTHRAIKALLRGERYRLRTPEGMVAPPPLRGRRAPEAKPAEPKPAPGRRVDPDLASWELVGLHCSALERRADEATRDVESWLKCWYMRDKLGEEFVGSVTAVTGFGVFVQLTALFVEGLIHISELGAEYFRFDEARNELRGERTGKRYALGDRVLVQVSRVDLDGRRIDFRLVSDTLRPGVGSAPAASSRKRSRKAQVDTAVGGAVPPALAGVEAEDSDHSVFTLPPPEADTPRGARGRKSRGSATAGAKPAKPAQAAQPAKPTKAAKGAKPASARNARSTRARSPRKPAAGTRARRAR
ncbi:MAG: RNB domain-containing ribonuclease, partial [Betaproteobacteria bacterium]|nr:RNB domain-containing ribonuclease [Betaproteobacteria bacterium]